jgi:hypothetical protein
MFVLQSIRLLFETTIGVPFMTMLANAVQMFLTIGIFNEN